MDCQSPAACLCSGAEKLLVNAVIKWKICATVNMLRREKSEDVFKAYLGPLVA